VWNRRIPSVGTLLTSTLTAACSLRVSDPHECKHNESKQQMHALGGRSQAQRSASSSQTLDLVESLVVNIDAYNRARSELERR
jgi:hypothetical protein